MEAIPLPVGAGVAFLAFPQDLTPPHPSHCFILTSGLIWPFGDNDAIPKCIPPLTQLLRIYTFPTVTQHM